MIVTTYTCDKCGHEQTDDEQMWDIGVSVAYHSFAQRDNYRKEPVKKELWCRACVVKLGLLSTSSVTSDPSQPETPLTLEDIIREIIREEIDSS